MRARGDGGFRRLVKGAWIEFAVTRQLSTGQAKAMVEQWRVPGWFILEELGFGLGCGPSILWWTNEKVAHNRRAREFFERQQKAPETTSDERQRCQQQLEQQGVGVKHDCGDDYCTQLGRHLVRHLRARPRKRTTARDRQRMLRDLGRRAGVSVRNGQIVDERRAEAAA